MVFWKHWWDQASEHYQHWRCTNTYQKGGLQSGKTPHHCYLLSLTASPSASQSPFYSLEIWPNWRFQSKTTPYVFPSNTTENNDTSDWYSVVPVHRHILYANKWPVLFFVHKLFLRLKIALLKFRLFELKIITAKETYAMGLHSFIQH